MKTRVQKWGNSLALRIPKSFADEVGLRERSLVEVSLVKRRLIVASAATKSRFNLKELLAQITEDNVHDEFDMGVPVGKEIW